MAIDQALLFASRHPAIVKCWKYMAFSRLNDAMVLLCEVGALDSVKGMVEEHDVEKTGMSVAEMLNREGKNSSGESARPIDAAATALKFDILE